LEIKEIKSPHLSASLVAQSIAQQIEKRMPFRQILKKTIEKTMTGKEAKGIRIEVAGRLNGIEIARREWLSQGRLPRNTLRADIDYAQDEAHCTYGKIGIKVWIYKGDKFD
jgi:small subunit ribosomal protein S3